jgi:hypothetical protein
MTAPAGPLHEDRGPCYVQHPVNLVNRTIDSMPGMLSVGVIVVVVCVAIAP